MNDEILELEAAELERYDDEVSLEPADETASSDASMGQVLLALAANKNDTVMLAHLHKMLKEDPSFRHLTNSIATTQ